MTERIIHKDLLMVLLNELRSSDKHSFRVKYPFYDVTLFDFHSDFRITNVISKDRLQGVRSEHMPDSNFLASDLPGFDELETSFLSCGIMEYDNWKEFRKWMEDMIGESRDPRRMAGSLAFAIDTNVLYNRFFTQYLPSRMTGFDLSNIDTVISNLVREEISSRITYKYRAGNIHKLKEVFRNKSLLDEFGNRNMLTTRKAKLAQLELDSFTRELSAPSVAEGRLTREKEEMDIEIVRSYKAFSQQCGFNIALITLDQNMADHAKNHGMIYHTLVHPGKPFGGGRVGPWCSLAFFHDLAVRFGVLSLSGIGVTVFGEWRGKTNQDYSKERLKLVIEEKSSVHDRLLMDLDLCDRVLES